MPDRPTAFFNLFARKTGFIFTSPNAPFFYFILFLHFTVSDLKVQRVMGIILPQRHSVIFVFFFISLLELGPGSVC